MFIRLAIFLTVVISYSNAQTIEGRVSGVKQQALPFVSVTLDKDSQVMVAGITDEKGYFRLTAALKQQGTYVLHFSLVGYSSRKVSFVYNDTFRPFKIVLEEDPKLLAGVTVRGRATLITRKSDRYIVNVENGPLANGLSATEVLRRSPGVWVDNMGNIRLRGNQPVTVMINDIVQRMGEEELADLIRSLKSEEISRIEVIPNPPSEFEAGGSGGIIHIVLKKGKRNGWNGNANAQYWQQGQKPYVTVGATLNHQLRKLYLSGSYTYVKDLRAITERTSITYPGLSAFENATERDEKIGRHQYRFGSVYDINTKHSVGMQTVFSRTGFRHIFQSNEWYHNGVSSEGTATTIKQRVFDLSGITLHYLFKPDTSGTILKIIADFSETKRDEQNRSLRINSDSSKERTWRNTAPTNTGIYTIQADFTRPFRTHTVFQSGIKYASIDRSNQLVTEDLAGAEWRLNNGQSNHFVYKENIVMAYTSLEHSVRHTTIKAGLRAEETFSSGNEKYSATRFSRRYFGLFPSVSVMQLLDAEKETSVTASYARRLTRPALNELNPARLEFSSYTALTGNPNLLPQYSHNFALSWQFLKHHAAEAYFVRTSDFIALSANAGTNNAIEYIFENTGSTTEYGLSFNSTITPVKAWNISTNLSLYRSAYRFNDQPYRQTSFYGQSLHTITVSGTAELDLTADYRSPFIYTNLYTYGNFSVDAGLTKKLLKAKARVRVSVTDLFNTSREKEWTEDKGAAIAFYRKRPTRTLRLSFTYQFSSGKKVQNKNIEQGGSDERRRIGN